MRDDLIQYKHLPCRDKEDLNMPLFIRVDGEAIALPCHGYAVEVTPEGFRLVLLAHWEKS